MNTYIGIDLGTSSVKLLLVAADGRILNTVTKTYPVFYPHSGWSEQRPEDWYAATVAGIRELVAENGGNVRGIGIGGQMHGLVALDSAGQVIRPCILWNDGRTERQTEYLNGVIGKDRLLKDTANIAFAGFTAPKILWLKENEPQNFERMRMILLPKDYLVYRLTGNFSTDYSDASGTLLLDVENKNWSADMLDICGIGRDMLPKLFHSYAPVGKLLTSIADELGLSTDVTVCAGAGDNAAAAVGTGTVKGGACNISLGTSGTVFIPRDEFTSVPEGALHSFCHATGGYHLMGCILSAASCNTWWMENILKTDDFAAEQQGLAQKLGKNRLHFLPYLMGERSPHNDVNARGAFIGMRPDTTRGDMTLAVMEGVAFALKDCVEPAKKCGTQITGTRICGGGARSALWREIIANVMNIPVEVPKIEEGPSYGGAMLAMVACGEYADIAECADAITGVKELTLPDGSTSAMYEEKYGVFTKLYPALKAVYPEI